MSLRSLTRILWTALKAVAVLLVGLGVVFLLLTRTDRGRNLVVDAMVDRFDQRYAGSLEIERLEGTLSAGLRAREVKLLDPRGHLVVRSESVQFRPRWWDLLRRRVTIRSLHLRNADLFLVRPRPGAPFTLSSALRRTSGVPDSTVGDWELFATDLTVRSGAIHTAAPGPPGEPAPNRFDPANTSVDSLDLAATLEWGSRSRLVDVQRASGYLPELDLPLRSLQGQLVIEPDTWSLQQIELRTARTRLAGSARLDSFLTERPRALPDLVPDLDRAGRVRLHLAPSRLSGREVSLFRPDLRMRDTLRASAEIRGAPDSLVVDSFALARGRSRVTGSATVESGLDSVRVRFRTEAAPLDPTDLETVFSEWTPDRMRTVGPVRGPIDGRAAWEASPGARPAEEGGWDVAAELALSGEGGRISGTVDVSGDPTSPVRYRGRVRMSDLDPGALLDRPSLEGALSGRVELSGRGVSGEELTAEGSVHLGPSRIGPRSVDSLTVSLVRSPDRVRARTRLYQGDGYLVGEATYLPSPAAPRYRLDLRTRHLDLATLIPSDTLHTDLDAELSLNGRGTAETGYRGTATVRLDSSSVRIPRGTLPIAPALTRMVLRPRSSSLPRFEVSGDLVEARISGDYPLDLLTRGARTWARAFARSWEEVTDKTLPQVSASPADAPGSIGGTENESSSGSETGRPSVAGPSAAEQQAALNAALVEEGFENGLRGTGTITVRRTLLFTTITSGVPRLTGPFSLSARWHLDADSLRLDTELTGDSLAGPRLRTMNLTANGSVRARYGPSLVDETRLTARVRIGRLDRGAQTYRGNRVLLSYAPRSARVQVESDSIGTTGALRAAVDVDLLPDRNRLTVEALNLELRDTQWITPEPQTIDWYRNGWVFHDLYLRQRQTARPEAPRDSIPHLALTGTLADRGQRSATLRAQRLRLEDFSRIVGLRRPWGGALEADVTLARPRGAVEATGTVRVRDLSFDGHPLGRLEADSRFVPGSDRIEVSMELAHAAPLPNGVQNQLTAEGVVGLPSYDTRGTYLDPGFIDLDVRVGEADLFFFEDIFDEVADVDGVARGTGQIGGTFRRPVFQGDVQIPGGSFRMPRFGLTYELSGPVRISREGFHLNSVRVTDGTGGSASVSGDILFNDYEFWSFDLTGQAEEFQIVDVTNSRSLPWYGRIWASGSASLTGPLDDALLRSDDLTSTPASELYIPVRAVEPETDEAYIVYVDSTGTPSDRIARPRQPAFVPAAQRDENVFLENLDMNLNIDAPRGSTVHLVFDPLLGDAVEAVGSGRIQFNVTDGDVTTFGTFNVTGGEYLFTASEMFSRRFELEPGSTITWDGDPIDAQLDIQATYRTRASLAGLPGRDASERIPMVIWLDMTGRVSSPTVDLRLAIDRDERTQVTAISSLEPILNDEERAAEYATSVLLTNSFRLTLTGDTQGLTESVDQLAFSTLSQLVANQLNRFVNHALSNVDINLGVQQGTNVQDLDVTYGVALYLLDERLVIRGQGVYETAESQTTSDNLQGKITVEVRLNQSVSVEVFYRREDEILETISSTAPSYGAGVSYQTEFTSWSAFLNRRLEGWKKMWSWFTELILPSAPLPERTASPPTDSSSVAPVDSVGAEPPDTIRTDTTEGPLLPPPEAALPPELIAH